MAQTHNPDGRPRPPAHLINFFIFLEFSCKKSIHRSHPSFLETPNSPSNMAAKKTLTHKTKKKIQNEKTKTTPKPPPPTESWECARVLSECSIENGGGGNDVQYPATIVGNVGGICAREHSVRVPPGRNGNWGRGAGGDTAVALRTPVLAEWSAHEARGVHSPGPSGVWRPFRNGERGTAQKPQEQ